MHVKACNCDHPRVLIYVGTFAAFDLHLKPSSEFAMSTLYRQIAGIDAGQWPAPPARTPPWEAAGGRAGKRWFVGLLLAAAALAAVPPARAEPPADYCRRVGTDDARRTIPPEMAPAVEKLFALSMPDDPVARTTYFRCLDGAVMACNVGANLPCGKANASRSIPAARQYCRSHPDASFIPMAVTGHDTIYRWRCSGTHAMAGGPGEALDSRGFIARLWKPVP